jgi:hypothetical protein
MLKILMVGSLYEKTWLARLIRHATKPPRKRSTLAVDVHCWSPPVGDGEAVKCCIWDAQGATSTIAGSPNFGGHPATQSLFFSSQSLYVLVWDLSGNNPKTEIKLASRRGDEKDDDDEEDEYYDDFVREESNRQADRALQADIQSHVLSWVDVIARRGPNSAILPVAVIPEGMIQQEVKRRCSMVQTLLDQHIGNFLGDYYAPKLLTGVDDILCVNASDGYGVEQLRETIHAIATDSSQEVFTHVGAPVPKGTVLILDVVRRLKQDHKLVLLDHLLAEVDAQLDKDSVIVALEFLSSVGEILYYGTNDDVLSHYIILSRKWLVSALSCVLRNDLKREVDESRKFMQMQCLYSDNMFPENDMVKALTSGTASSIPLLSNDDAKMLWQSMNFMREAADRYAELGEDSTTTPTMFYFLERLLVRSGVLMPLGLSDSSLDDSEVFFVPSLLAHVETRDIWTFRSSESWITTLCHSWLFRDGAPSDVMEHISVELLRDLYKFSRSFQGNFSDAKAHPPHRSKTVPISRPTLHEFYSDHDDQVIGRVRINQIVCWKKSILVKVGTVFADKESDELRENFVEVLVTVVDQSSNHCVASDAMRSGMHRVVVSGKGQIGHHGKKLWKGGYKTIFDSVRSTLSRYSNVDSQVVRLIKISD